MNYLIKLFNDIVYQKREAETQKVIKKSENYVFEYVLNNLEKSIKKS